jgi:hypothetical protein
MRAVPSLLFALAASGSLLVSVASAQSFSFSTNDPDGKMAMATNPGLGGQTERESADDFLLNAHVSITGATFTGLITGTNPTIGDVVAEIYRVFPRDSQNPPSGNVPTRNNSPSDVAFDHRDSATPDLTFSTAILSGNFPVANSVLDGIHPKPNFFTGGDGAVTGTEVKFTVDFTEPFDLPPNHYFFVPQVQVNGGQFYWLSAPKPIVSPGTPFNPDLQTWIRNEALQPDWLRVGTDILNNAVVAPQPQFNAAFSLSGTVVPESNSLWLIAAAAAVGVLVVRRTRRSTA